MKLSDSTTPFKMPFTILQKKKKNTFIHFQKSKLLLIRLIHSDPFITLVL